MAEYSRECGHCGVHAAMRMYGEEHRTNTNGTPEVQAVFICESCGHLSLATVRERNWTGWWDEADWLPPTLPERTFASTPEGIRDCANEALALRSLGYYRASVLLANTAIVATADMVKDEVPKGRRKAPYILPVSLIAGAGYLPNSVARTLDRNLQDLRGKANRPILDMYDHDAEQATTIMRTVLANVWDAKASEWKMQADEQTEDGTATDDL